MSILQNGYGAPFIRVFYFKAGATEGKDTFRPIRSDYVVSSLTYKYAEEEDDEATIVIETADATIADRPEFQKGANLKVLWGYIQGPQSRAMSVYIRDVATSYDEKVTLTLSCTDKASALKDNTSQEIHSAEVEGEDREFNVMKILSDFCKKYGLTLHLTGSNPFGDMDFKVNPRKKQTADPNGYGMIGVKPAKSKGYFESTGQDDIAKLPKDFEFNRYMYYPQANKSDFQLLFEMLKKEKNGPYVLSGRNETLLVAKRDLSQKPSKQYRYRGGSGELLNFHISDKGQVTESEANSVQMSAWDSEVKEYQYTNKASENTPTEKLNENTQEGWLSWFNNPLVEGASTASLISWGSRIGVRALTSTGKLGSYAIRGLGFLESVAVVGAYYTSQFMEGAASGNSSQQAYKDLIKLRPESKTAGKWNTEAGGGVGTIWSRKIYAQSGAVIKERVELDKSLLTGGHTITSTTYTADIEESQKNARLLKELRDSGKGYDHLIGPLAEALKNTPTTSNRYSAEDPEIAALEAENLKQENELEKLKASASCLGDPKVTDMQVVTILGVGNLYSGNYYIKKCTHTVTSDGGYRLELDELCSNSVGADDEKTNLTPNAQLPGPINIVVADNEIKAEGTYVVTASPS